MMVDIDAVGSGDLAPKLIPYSASVNRAHLVAGLEDEGLPSGILDTIAAYPAMTSCREGAK